MFSKILVAVDGSEQSDRAVDTAIDLARKYDGLVIALCVYRHHSQAEASLSMVRVGLQGGDTPDQALKQFATETAAAAKARLIEGGVEKVEAFAKRGHPARAIVDFADQRNCDAIVLGARGHGDADGFFLGSVSHKVVGLSKVTCVVAK
ncbi:universal stress protein [Pelagibacterium lentulum]|uniref:Universal stress protein YxiE n=1 Tax=Pelagibacterium lentulum TaxID=2029865 RepID=A0A916RL59_9HYPH|nr:universal stress protein [Pelagibacterium lentulum]GGA61530.1 universal stress protein YxiE [Pelagibacterium lentulum]